ncbi:hypothetical protein XELAEV_18022590mg [Xenopus laevis]|uniref:Uncharacterized protein n=1 Tax=Xenopus laevis TaxID=8355 RepID=A0A974HNU9_XENLA|nr:hypothetical protein XELAEV_18022590mg [Xenopus laevis]
MRSTRPSLLLPPFPCTALWARGSLVIRICVSPLPLPPFASALPLLPARCVGSTGGSVFLKPLLCRFASLRILFLSFSSPLTVVVRLYFRLGSTCFTHTCLGTFKAHRRENSIKLGIKLLQAK